MIDLKFVYLYFNNYMRYVNHDTNVIYSKENKLIIIIYFSTLSSVMVIYY